MIITCQWSANSNECHALSHWCAFVYCQIVAGAVSHLHKFRSVQFCHVQSSPHVSTVCQRCVILACMGRRNTKLYWKLAGPGCNVFVLFWIKLLYFTLKKKKTCQTIGKWKNWGKKMMVKYCLRKIFIIQPWKRKFIFSHFLVSPW